MSEEPKPEEAEFHEPSSVPPEPHPFLTALAAHVVRRLGNGDRDIYRDVMADVDREVIRTTLNICRYNNTRAARRLGLSRMTLRMKVRAIAIHANRNSGSQGEPPGR